MNRARSAVLLAIFVLTSCGGGTVDVGTSEEPAAYLAQIDASTLGDPPPADALSGIWVLSLEGDSYRLEQESFRVEEDFVLEEDEFVVSGVPAPKGAFNCYLGGGKRTLERTRGTYRVDMEDDELTLSLVEDPCPLRASILARTWRKSRS
ncbi:MAG TPA: hypothetical protein VM784_13010 [Actinomycetota bacterium]|nr:hypothetical protein [Actinomycetota bacterium]